MRYLFILILCAIISCDNSDTYNTETTEISLVKGNTHLKDGNYTEALNFFTEIITGKNTYTNLDQAYIGRGYAKLKLSFIHSAITDFKKALELDPLNISANAGLAISLFVTGQFSDALTESNNVLLKNNNYIYNAIRTINNKDLHLINAQVYLHRGEFKNSFNEIKAGLKVQLDYTEDDPLLVIKLIQTIKELTSNHLSQ